MITLRPAAARGHADHGWLRSFHSFSFADYYDPEHMGFRSLRVINEDIVAGGMGFGMHGHRDMEILTYVLSGRLAHRDSLGNGADITPGEVQRMSAGHGIRHSEMNPSASEPVHLLQIWIEPVLRGVAPSYAQERFPVGDGLQVVASPDGQGGSLTINAAAVVHAGRLAANASASIPLSRGRHAWVQVARGSLLIDGHALTAGDGAAISDQDAVNLNAGTNGCEVVVFDLA